MGLLDAIPGMSGLKMAAAGLAGAVVAGALLAGYNQFVENPRIRAEARAAVTAELTANFFKATGDLNNAAEKARAARRFCVDSGRMYDFATGDCR